ncbi:MAG: hypothetical protein FJ390_04280 [Verrucomicrobia bacterium]|nr:hypothetical protein [Verrucomicrobiota bacterium]
MLRIPPPSIFRFIRTLSIAMALFSLCGGHWAVLQGIAWSRMLQSYATKGSFQSAVEKTFDGKHRCSLCKKIEQAKQQEKKNSFVNETFKKKEGVLEQSFLLLTLFPSDFHFSPMKKSFYGGPITRPLLPPPQIA